MVICNAPKDDKTLVSEAFEKFGKTWKGMEDHIAMCYTMNLNPMPWLRGILGNICSVEYRKISGGKWRHPSSGTDTLLVLHSEESNTVVLQLVTQGEMACANLAGRVNGHAAYVQATAKAVTMRQGTTEAAAVHA